MESKALFPGSFDPPTRGHIDLVERGRRLFDVVVVAVGVNPNKRSLFSAQERIAMIEAATRHLDGVAVTSFSGLVADCARMHGCASFLRGVRTPSDFENEFQRALTNRALDPSIDTVLLVPDQALIHVSSTLVREVAACGGDVSPFLPPGVGDQVRERMRSHVR